MRVGITCYPSEGGSGIVATELGKQLARLGHEVHFITSSLPVRLRGFEERICFHEVRPENYPVFHYPPYSLSLAAKMAEVARTHHLDVLHAHYAMPHAASAYLARQMLADHRVRTVTTLHGTDITLVGQAPSFYEVTKFSIEQSDAVTAVSGWLEAETRRIFRTDRDIRVIHNFIDVDTFKPRALGERRARFASPGEAVLLHISNFRPVKNLRALVEVFRRVNERHPSRLLLVGDGPERLSVLEMVRALGLQDRVQFLGNQEYVEDLLPIADVFLLPSLHESFGLTVLEAMAVGVPVVATNVGGTAEVVAEGETGYLRSPHDVDGMVEAVEMIVSDPDRAASMGEAGRRRAREFFHVDRIVPQYLEVYES